MPKPARSWTWQKTTEMVDKLNRSIEGGLFEPARASFRIEAASGR
jgi:hypothetical protein